MSHNYEKHTWSVGEVITKALIDRMEAGIYNAVDKSGDTITYRLDFVKNSNPSPQQKGTVLWDEVAATDNADGYGRMKVQQYGQITSLNPDGFYINTTNNAIADTYSFPKKLATDLNEHTYNVFTSKGASRGIAWFNDNDPTEGTKGILNYLAINDNAKGKFLQINSNGQPTWATGNYTLSLNGNTLSLIPGTTGGTSTVTLASGIAYSLAVDNDNNKIYLSGSTGNTGFTVTKGTNETLSLNPTTHLIDCKIPTLRAANELYVNVSGDTMTGYLNIGNTSNPIPTSGGKSPFSVYTNGQQLELHGYTKLYRNANSDDSNSEILKVYGKAAITHSTTIGGEMVAEGIVYCGTLMPSSGVTPVYSDGKVSNYSYENTPSIPAFNMRPQVKVVDSNLTDDIDDTTQNRTLCAIRSRFWRINNNNNKVQDGKNRTMYFTQSVYQDDLFTEYKTGDKIGDFEYITIVNEEQQTIEATVKADSQLSRGSANFYLPTTTFSDWQTSCIDYYKKGCENGTIVPEIHDNKTSIDANYSQTFEILTTKNYEIRRGSFTLKDIFDAEGMSTKQKTINNTTVNVYEIKAIATSGYDGPLISSSIEFTDDNQQKHGFSNNNYSINVTSCSSYSSHWAGHFATFLPHCLWQGVPHGQTTFIFQLIVTQDVDILPTDAAALTFNYIAVSANPETLGNE